MSDLNKVQNLKPFKHFCMSIGALPSSYLECMTYLELLMWFCDYLKNTIIPTINNNGESVKELQNLFTELQNYVSNYFDNLDAQEEINNKLDEMVEDGTLDNIIGRYITRILPRTYDTLNDMKLDTSLQNGMFAQTLGYYSKNDGGGACYLIFDNIENEDDNGSLHTLNNGNRAIIYTNTGHIKMEQFGIMGNEPNNTNCNEQFTKLLNYASTNNLEIDCMKKTYICFAIKIPANTRINGNGATFKKPDFRIEPYNEQPSVYGRRGIFKLDPQTSDNEPLPIKIKDCTFDGNCWVIWNIEDGYSQEQGSLITVFGKGTLHSRIHAEFYNIIVQNSASDGFHIRDHADVYIENAKSFECFRGGLTCTGGGSLVKVNGFEFNGNLVNDGIDFETDSGNTETNQYFLSNITINNDLDLGDPGDNALIIIDKMLSKGSCIIRGTKKGVHILNSYFKISDPSLNFTFANVGNEEKFLTFDNCVFDGAINELTNEGTYINLQHLYPGDDQQQLKTFTKFKNCLFKNLWSIIGGPDYNAQISFEGCNFDSSITGIAINEKVIPNVSLAPRILDIKNCTFNNAKEFLRASGNASKLCYVNIDNIEITNPDNLGMNVYRAIVKFNQIFFQNGYNISWQADNRKRMFGNRTIITNDTSKVPNNSFYGVHGSDTFIIMNETYTTPLAKFVYNDNTSSWDTIFNNIT